MGADKRCFLSPVFGACDRSHAPQVVNLILSTGQPSKSPAKGQNVTSAKKKYIRTTPGKSVPGSEKGLSIVVCLIVPLTHCPCTYTAISAHPGPPGHLSFT